MRRLTQDELKVLALELVAAMPPLNSGGEVLSRPMDPALRELGGELAAAIPSMDLQAGSGRAAYDGYQIVTWDACLWQPEGIKTSAKPESEKWEPPQGGPG